MQQFEKAEWLSLKEHPELNEKWVQELIATEQNRRGFLQVAGVAAATFTLDGLRSAAHAASEATGKMKIENVGLMSPGDMGQAVAMQIKAKGLNVYTALEQRSARTRALAREAGLTDVGTVARLVAECGHQPFWVLADFDPQWPVLKLIVAEFNFCVREPILHSSAVMVG